MITQKVNTMIAEVNKNRRSSFVDSLIPASLFPIDSDIGSLFEFRQKTGGGALSSLVPSTLFDLRIEDNYGVLMLEWLMATSSDSDPVHLVEFSEGRVSSRIR